MLNLSYSRIPLRLDRLQGLYLLSSWLEALERCATLIKCPLIKGDKLSRQILGAESVFGADGWRWIPQSYSVAALAALQLAGMLLTVVLTLRSGALTTRLFGVAFVFAALSSLHCILLGQI